MIAGGVVGWIQPQVVLAQAPGLTISAAGGAVTLTVHGTAGHVLMLERTLSISGATWLPVTSGVFNVSGEFDFTTPNALTAHFYRAQDVTDTLFSTNIVGVANLLVPPNGNFITNPFLAADPSLGMMLSSMTNGISVFKIGAGGMYEASSYVNGWSNPNLALRPGEGFFVRNPTATTVPVMFIGDVVPGSSTNHLAAGWILCASTLPEWGGLDSLGYPVADGDTVYFWNPTLNAFDGIYTFFMGIGWFDTEFGPGVPPMGLGQSFWAQRSFAADWVRTSGGTGHYKVTSRVVTASAAVMNFMTFNAAGAQFGRVLGTNGSTPLGGAFRGQLYGGTSSVESSLTAMGSPATFGAGSAAGYLNEGLVIVPGAVPGNTVYVQLRAWQASAGATYEAALLASGTAGISTVESFVLTSGVPWAFPADANTFATFSLSQAGPPPVAPSIQVQPQDVSVVTGASPFFQVRAVGTPPLSYQWVYNATPSIPGAVSDRLILPFVPLSAAGDYDVVVTSPYGSVRSAAARLTVTQCAPAPAGMAGWWPGNGHAQDLIGGNRGTLTNGAGYASGIVNQAFHFDGINDHVVIPHAAAPSFAGSFTMEMWIRPETLANSPALIEKGILVGDRIGMQVTAAGRVGGYFDGGGYSAVSDPGALSVGRFSHVAFVLDDPADEARVYVDGFLVATGVETRVPAGNTYPWFLGQAGSGSGFNYHGTIDELALYDRVLSGSELRSIFQKGPAGRCGTGSVPFLLAQPASQTVGAGGPAVLSAPATGLPDPGYQWRRNGVNLTGATNRSLTLSNTQVADAGTYTVVVANSFGSVVSQPAVLTVTTSPLITRQPVGRAVLEGSMVVLDVSATGTSPLGFQWQFEGVDMPGETNAALVLDTIQGAQSGGYRARVTNGFGSSTSMTAMVLVLQAPKILAPLTGTNVNLGDPFTLCVMAGGSEPLQFQWRKNGLNIRGATNACYGVSSAEPGDGGSYSVLIVNEVGLVASAVVPVVVALEELIAGDRFDERVLLESQTVRATNVGATKEPGEPDHAGQPGGRSVWYRRIAGVSGIATVRTSGSTFDTLLAIYKGSSVEGLTFVASDEDQAGFFASELKFNVVAGTEYQIAVDGFDGAGGEFVISWELEATTDPLPLILGTSPSQTVAFGGSAEFYAVATGGGALDYQWLFNGAVMAGETRSNLTVMGASAAHVGQYQVRVDNEFGRFIVSPPMTLEIGALANVQSAGKISNPTQMANTSGLTGGKFDGRSPGIAAGSGILVGAGTTASQIVNTTNSVRQAGEPNHCGRLGSATRWLVLRPAAGGMQLHVDTQGSLIGTVLAVYTRNTILDPLVEVACANSTTSSMGVQFAAVANRDYWIAVDGLNGAQGVIRLNWGLGVAPSVVVAPPITEAVLGEGIVWSVALASGNPPPWLQWRFNGQDIAGENSLVLALNQIGAANQGAYSVVVSNLLGAIEQPVASLTVDQSQEAALRHDFEAGTEDWLILSAGVTNNPTHESQGGRPGGYVWHTDASDPVVWSFQAPAGYVGNQSAAYGGSLRFDLVKTATSPGTGMPDVTMVTGMGILVFGLPSHPGVDWTSYEVPLNESAGWLRDSLSGDAPTQSEMLGMLSRVERWLIRGDYSVEPHSTGLDNVRVVRPTLMTLAQLTAVMLPGGDLVLEWPAAASGFQIESASHPLNVSGWNPVQAPPILSENGLMRVQLSSSAVPRFFRLRRQ